MREGDEAYSRRRLHSFSLLLVLKGTRLGESRSYSSPWATCYFEAACGTCEHCLCTLGVSWGSCLDPTALAEPHRSSPSQGLHAFPRGTLCLSGVGRLPRSWAMSQHEAQQGFQQGNAVRKTIKWLLINSHNFIK